MIVSGAVAPSGAKWPVPVQIDSERLAPRALVAKRAVGRNKSLNIQNGTD